jgi:hypothetical protein
MVAPAPALEDFIKRGFLPDNLPPCYSSVQLWKAYSGLSDYIVDSSTSQLTRFNASKRGNQRRGFAVPHPNYFFDQALFFQKNWNFVERIMRASRGSLSFPEFGASEARAVKITAHSMLPEYRLKRLARFRYCLVADVSRYFPSIYTHGIPWALHGRDAAKRDRRTASMSVFGNRLDYALRQGQDGQTIGIPIGPDTSRLIGEVVLSAIDVQIQSDRPEFSDAFIRHVDDYWVGGDTVEDCQMHLRALRRGLHDYELDVNELKTRIVSSSQIFADAWPLDLERGAIRAIARAGEAGSGNYNAIVYLGKIIEYVNLNNDDALIKNLIRRIDRARLWDSGWGFLQSFLVHCAVQFPHAFDRVARVLVWRKRRGLEVDRDLWGDVINRVIRQNSDYGHDSEVAWALWLLVELDLKLSGDLARKIISRNSALVISYLVHMSANNRVPDLDVPQEVIAHCGTDVDSRYWPALLEMNYLQMGAISPSSLGGPEILKRIFSNGCSLIDWGVAPLVFQSSAGDTPSEPAFAIEENDSDYDGGDLNDEISINSDEEDF